MEINVQGLSRNPTIFPRCLARHMSLLVPGAYRAEANIRNKPAKSTTKTIGVTSKCFHKAAPLEVGSLKPQRRDIFVAVTNASASSAKDPAVGITNWLETSWTEMTGAIGKSTITLNVKSKLLEIQMFRLPQMSICAASMM